MNGLSFSATTEKRKGLLLDPRTKLILLLTITTLMFSTSNEGIMNIVKPCLSLVPFALILAICGLLYTGTDCPYEFERITLVHRAGSDIYHDAVCARHYDRCLSDLIHFGQ